MIFIQSSEYPRMVFPQHVHQLGRELRSRDFRLGRLFAGTRGDFHGDVPLFGFSDASERPSKFISPSSVDRVVNDQPTILSLTRAG